MEEREETIEEIMEPGETLTANFTVNGLAFKVRWTQQERATVQFFHNGLHLSEWDDVMAAGDHYGRGDEAYLADWAAEYVAEHHAGRLADAAAAPSPEELDRRFADEMRLRTR